MNLIAAVRDPYKEEGACSSILKRKADSEKARLLAEEPLQKDRRYLFAVMPQLGTIDQVWH